MTNTANGLARRVSSIEARRQPADLVTVCWGNCPPDEHCPICRPETARPGDLVITWSDDDD